MAGIELAIYFLIGSIGLGLIMGILMSIFGGKRRK